MLSRKRSSLPSIDAVGVFLSPLWEGPTPNSHQNSHGSRSKKETSWESLLQWMKEKSSFLPNKTSEPKVLLGVLGFPLAPFPVSNDNLPCCLLSLKGMPLETSCAQYIVQQYLAAVGGSKLLSSIKNSYARGKVRMLTTEFETATRIAKKPTKAAENGWFVLWQMLPNKWHVELEIEGNTVQAGSNGNILWRSTSWLGAHEAKGPVRPLRRAVQGLDPVTTANLFIDAKCIGEKKVGDDDCFVLKLAVDPAMLSLRKSGAVEVIRHTLNGYFSQKTGLLVFVEDSHLIRIQCSDTDTVYWETTMESFIQDYRSVDGVNIAHSGHTVVTLFRFGEEAMSHTKTKMEEMWEIEEVAFNVQGLSADCFLPPTEVGGLIRKRAADDGLFAH